MEFLGEWLKEIIVVVLFAVFIDLLLPNRSMERYVKFVVSLLILLTLLSPVMRIFSSDAKQKIETAFAESWSSLDGTDTKESTETILWQGEQLRKQREAEALQWAGEEAARQMKEQIERTTGQPVERVTVILTERLAPADAEEDSKMNTEQAVPSIRSVEVIMKVDAEAPELSDTSRKIEIQPVGKIKVEISEGQGEAVKKQDSGNPNPMTGVDDITASEAMAEADSSVSRSSNADLEKPKVHALLEGEIEELLYQEWGISRESVTVKSGNPE